MRGMDIFQKPYYREISTMRGRPMRGLPVSESITGQRRLAFFGLHFFKSSQKKNSRVQSAEKRVES